jgi:hypothetical protein
MGTLSDDISNDLSSVLISRPALHEKLIDLRLPHLKCVSSTVRIVVTFTSIQRLNLDENYLGECVINCLARNGYIFSGT